MLRSLLSLLLLLAVLASTLPAFAADEPESYTHTAIAASGLKIRKTGTKSSKSVGQISKGATVFITEYGPEWCKVIKGATEGYVMTRYLEDITPVAGYEDNSGDDDLTDPLETQDSAVTAPARTADPVTGFTMNENTFVAKYYCYSLGTPNVYARPDAGSQVRFTLSKYQKIDVGEICGEWALICTDSNQYGYVKTTKVFEWDRYDPYAGPIPNMDVYDHILWTNKCANVYSVANGSVLWTTNPGAAIACWDKDEQGRYMVPIEREYGYVYEEDVAYVMSAVPWQEAQSGDLLSTMTTFYAVGVHTLQYQGRCWNVRLGGTYISGTVLQPGQKYNQNDTIGPYSGPSGYKKAPILSSESDSGYGGGTCQVNTTFYITTVSLPLMIDQRQVHQHVGMHYCKIGLDASVGAGNITLRMTNTMPYAIRYQFFITDGVLTCSIFRD